MRLQAFPRLSETFILNQIKFLLEKDVELHLFVNTVYYSKDLPLLLNEKLFIHIEPQRSIFSRIKACLKHLPHLHILIKSNIKSIIKRKRLITTPVPRFVFDILHCQYAVFLTEVLSAKEKGLLKFKGLIINGRGYDVSSDFLKDPSRYIDNFSNIDLFLPVSKSLASNFLNSGFDPDKIKVLHSGIDISKFQFKPFSKINEKNVIRLISIGRLVEKKGHILAVKATEALLKEGLNVELVIYGEGHLRDELTQYIKAHNLEKSVFLMGAAAHNDVIDYIRNSDIFVLPCVTGADGNQEGIPNVLKEAMALGVPVATSDHSGNKELLPQEYHKFISEEGNFEDLARTIKDLISLDANSMSDYLKRNREVIVDSFDIRLVTDQLYDHYLSVKKKTVNNE